MDAWAPPETIWEMNGIVVKDTGLRESIIVTLSPALNKPGLAGWREGADSYSFWRLQTVNGLASQPGWALIQTEFPNEADSGFCGKNSWF